MGIHMKVPSMNTLPTDSPIQYVTDIHLAAALLAQRYKLIRTERGPKGLTFIFEAPESAVFAFYSDEVQIPPRILLDCLRNLKSLIQGGREGGRR